MAEPPDGPAPLPESHDPYVVLDCAPGADERELKRAYARRIKVFRPDRAPQAFARIQAAFEHAKMRLSLVAAVADEHALPVDDPAPAVAAMESVAAPDVAEPVARRDVPIDGKVTWRALSQWRDLDAAFQVWRDAFLACIRTPTRESEAIAMANEPALLEDASTDPAPAVLVLQAVSALAWRDWGAASKLFRKLKAPARHPAVDLLIDRCTLDLEVASLAYERGRPVAFPPLVRDFLANAAFMTLEQREALATTLQTSMRDDSDTYLDAFTAILKGRKRLADALAHRLLHGVPTARRELMVLPEALGKQLTVEMRRASRWTWWILPLAAIALGIIGGALAASALSDVTLDHGRDEKAPVYGFCAVFGVGVAAAVGIDWLLYRTLIRRRIVGVMARVGVTRAVVRQWVGTSWLRARLRRFTILMGADPALQIIGMLAATVAQEPAAVEPEEPAR